MKAHPKTRGKRGKASVYIQGELNEFIDSLCHPLAKIDKDFILVDGILHGLVERARKCPEIHKI